MPETTERNYKRLHFFRGFRTTEKDWNEGERYHVDKRRLHNRMLHGPGVVGHALGGFRVSARSQGQLAVEVQSGYAIDGQGNDLFLFEPEIKQFSPADFKLPATVYLVARYVEEFTDFISYKENLDFKGHRRIAESVKIEWSVTEPDIQTEVELCRMMVTKDVKRILDARESLAPDANELDLRFVPQAGVVGSFLTPAMQWELLELIRKSKEVYALLFHKMGVLTASDVLHSFITLEMLLHARMIDLRNVFPIYQVLLRQQLALVADLEANHPHISAVRDFANYKKQVEIALQKYDERQFTLQFYQGLLGYQSESQRFMELIFQKQLGANKPKLMARQTDASAALEAIKVRSQGFDERLTVEGLDLVLVDRIDPIDPESEKAHSWKISGERDKYRTRQKLKYPDDVVVEDAGVAFEGGQLDFELKHIEPGKDVYLVWRMDYVYGDWEADFEANDRKLEKCVCAGSDKRFRWRNWVYVIPAEHVREVSLRMRWKPITAGRDINVFQLWAYQPVQKR